MDALNFDLNISKDISKFIIIYYISTFETKLKETIFLDRLLSSLMSRALDKDDILDSEFTSCKDDIEDSKCKL